MGNAENRKEGQVTDWNRPKSGDKTSPGSPAEMTPQERNETFQKGPADWGQEQGSQQQGNRRPMGADWQQPEVNRPGDAVDQDRLNPERMPLEEVEDEL